LLESIISSIRAELACPKHIPLPQTQHLSTLHYIDFSHECQHDFVREV